MSDRRKLTGILERLGGLPAPRPVEYVEPYPPLDVPDEQLSASARVLTSVFLSGETMHMSESSTNDLPTPLRPDAVDHDEAIRLAGRLQPSFVERRRAEAEARNAWKWDHATMRLLYEESFQQDEREAEQLRSLFEATQRWTKAPNSEYRPNRPSLPRCNVCLERHPEAVENGTGGCSRIEEAKRAGTFGWRSIGHHPQR